MKNIDYYDVKDDLMDLIQKNNDFLGAEELQSYFKKYNEEKNLTKTKKNLIKFCIYRLSLEFENKKIKK